MLECDIDIQPLNAYNFPKTQTILFFIYVYLLRELWKKSGMEIGALTSLRCIADVQQR